METESEAAKRLQAAFEGLGNPMLLVDDERRCVTANAPACGLLGIEPLASGAIEGWYHLPLPTGRVLPS